jgi:tryptophan-rich sensory protein
MNFRNAAKLIVSILLAEGVGIAGALFTAPAIPTWYAGLHKPALNPPMWVFGPVWTTLYLLMGIAAFLVWRRIGERPEVKAALVIYALQLLLNAIWSPGFFALHAPGAALVIISLLWVAIVATIWKFYPISRAASYLLIPYLLWVSFASYLNFSIWRLN